MTATRPVTFASNHAFDDVCFDLADVISINTYPGWYVGELESIADHLVESAKQAGHPPFGVEGADGGQWVLVDLEDVVVHIMQPKVRDFYQLERLWGDAGFRTFEDEPQAAAAGGE
mgnify:CR=1 FL=1